MYNQSAFDVTNQKSQSAAQNAGLLYNPTGAVSVIRVGDGTMVGTGTVANISTNITDKSGNSTTLVKTDLGTLNLSVANSYTGGDCRYGRGTPNCV